MFKIALVLTIIVVPIIAGIMINDMLKNKYKQGYLDAKRSIKQLPPKEIIVEVAPKGIIFQLSIEDLQKDLLNYKHLSKEHRREILISIQEASKKYSVNPIILYAMLHTESSFRWWITHGRSGQKDRAVGIAGVRYGIWGKSLMKAKIIETKSDLYTIDKGIHAMAWIYNHERQKPLKSDAKNADESAMLRYFGGNYKSYVEAINNKIAALFLQKMYRPQKKS